MISRNRRINALINLGNYLNDPTNSIEIEEHIDRAYAVNTWFTPYHCRLSLSAISEVLLEENNLIEFAGRYAEPPQSRKIGVVMAGNLPAVGFHDALCVLLSGHTLLAKLSKSDFALMHFLLTTLIRLEPELKEYVQFVERLNEADAYIATGSDNTARYFHYYFSKKPHIIRKNRTSVAILTGHESRAQLTRLGDDILRYFGLGCRNVSKLYVPVEYDFSMFFECVEEKRSTYANHNKYFNNYEYNKSILLVNRTEHLDNGFLIVTENNSLVSPLSVVYYETYTSVEQLKVEIAPHTEKIQCIVGETPALDNTVPFGTAQLPGLSDFADGVDTMAFLEKL